MRVCVANISKKITRDEFRATVQALGKQVHQDFAPAWGMDAELRFAALSRDSKPNPELNDADVILYVGELDDDPAKVEDAVGYHDLNHAGIPYGFVFSDVAAKLEEPWSVTLSHEVLELIADPDVNLLVAAPHPKKPRATVIRSYEVCDPVQEDTYSIDGIVVSNFVTPLYFANLARGTAARTNYLGLELERFGVRPGGYFSYLDLETKRWSDVFGERAEARAKIKEQLGKTRRMRRHRGLALTEDAAKP